MTILKRSCVSNPLKSLPLSFYASYASYGLITLLSLLYIRFTNRLFSAQRWQLSTITNNDRFMIMLHFKPTHRSDSPDRVTPCILTPSSMRVTASMIGVPVPSLSSRHLDFFILREKWRHQKQAELLTNQILLKPSYCVGGVWRLVCIFVLFLRLLVLAAGVGQVEVGQHHVLIVVSVILRFLCVIRSEGLSIMCGNKLTINVCYALNSVLTIHYGLLHRLYPGHDLSQVSERGVRTRHHL